MLDGPGFLEAYHALPGPHAPIILSTALPDPGLSGVAYLRRPFDVRVFVALVRADLRLGASS